MVYLQLKSRRTWVKVLRDHSVDNPPFPAVTIQRGEDEHIVRRDQIVGAEQIAAEKAENRRLDEESVGEVVTAFKAGNTTLQSIARHTGKQAIAVLSKCRKAQRMGLITLTLQP